MARRASLRRALATWLAPELTRRFDAAGGGRRWAHAPSFGSANPEALAASAPIRTRARHAVNNNAWARSGRDAWTTAAIGPGIEAKSAHPVAATRALLGAKFKEWTQHADADGLTDWFGVQAAVFDALVTDGEAFVQFVGDKLRILPAEMIDESKTSPIVDGAHDIAGIRYNAAGERIGYWVFTERPQDVMGGLTKSVLIPAADVLHIYRPIGPGAVRGVSWFSPVLLTLSELDQWSDAQLVNAKMQAMLAGFLIDEHGTGAPFEGDDISSISLEPGTMRRLPGGYDVKFSTPQQAQSAMEFGQFMLRAVAAGLGVPEFLLTGDMRGANYSSMRSALISFRQRVEQIQFQILTPQLLRPVWERAVTGFVLSGEIDAADFETNGAAWLAADFYPPAPPWVDPLKDAKAQREMVAGGFVSRRQVVASLGFDVEQVDAERAADAQREQALGLQPEAPEQTESEDSDEDA